MDFDFLGGNGVIYFSNYENTQTDDRYFHRVNECFNV